MDYKEQQEEEINVLESIYPDELEILSDNSLNVHIKLETAPIIYLCLQVTYPEEYPDVVPEISVVKEDGSYFQKADTDSDNEDSDEDEYYQDDDNDDSNTQQTSLDIVVDLDSEDLSNIKAKLQETAEENLGMPSVFALASMLKESGEEICATKVQQIEQQREKERLEQEAKDQAKFYGTPVTPESFSAWREKFMKEKQQQEAADADKKKTQQPVKLTGKQIFEQGLNKDDDELEELAAGMMESEIAE